MSLEVGLAVVPVSTPDRIKITVSVTGPTGLFHKAGVVLSSVVVSIVSVSAGAGLSVGVVDSISVTNATDQVSVVVVSPLGRQRAPTPD